MFCECFPHSGGHLFPLSIVSFAGQKLCNSMDMTHKAQAAKEKQAGATHHTNDTPLRVQEPTRPPEGRELSGSYSSVTVYPCKVWVPEAGFPRPGADVLSAGASCPEAIPATNRNRISFSCATQ